jgi:hypothetical protein
MVELHGVDYNIRRRKKLEGKRITMHSTYMKIWRVGRRRGRRWKN